MDKSVKEKMEEQLLKDYPDKYEKDKDTGILKKKGAMVIAGKDISQLAKDMVARKIADAEGKAKDETSLDKIKKRFGLDG